MQTHGPIPRSPTVPACCRAWPSWILRAPPRPRWCCVTAPRTLWLQARALHDGALVAEADAIRAALLETRWYLRPAATLLQIPLGTLRRALARHPEIEAQRRAAERPQGRGADVRALCEELRPHAHDSTHPAKSASGAGIGAKPPKTVHSNVLTRAR